MKDHSIPLTNLPPEQQAIRDKCFHPSAAFLEFAQGRVDRSIPERFERIVPQFSHRVAVKTADQSVTYAELDAQANRIARTLVAETGDRAVSVALLLETGLPLLAGMLPMSLNCSRVSAAKQTSDYGSY